MLLVVTLLPETWRTFVRLHSAGKQGKGTSHCSAFLVTALKTPEMLMLLLGAHPEESARVGHSVMGNLCDGSPRVPQETGQTRGSLRSHVHGELQACVPGSATRPQTERAAPRAGQRANAVPLLGEGRRREFYFVFYTLFPKTHVTVTISKKPIMLFGPCQNHERRVCGEPTAKRCRRIAGCPHPQNQLPAFWLCPAGQQASHPNPRLPSKLSVSRPTLCKVMAT